MLFNDFQPVNTWKIKSNIYLSIYFCSSLLLTVNTITHAQINTKQLQVKPNVLIFLVDDMGLMDTSVPFLTDKNGEPKIYSRNKYYKTPGMEKLAEQGIRFETCYANSVCSPSRVSLMTGQSSARHHVTQWIKPELKNEGPDQWRWKGLSSKDITLPRLLQANGYFTIHVGKAHFGPFGSEGENPRNLGFDINVAGSSIGMPGDYSGINNYGTRLRHVKDLEEYHGTNTHLTEALTKEMCKSIDKSIEQGKPFYASMSHYAVHTPFQEDPRYANQYDDELGKKMPAFASLVAGMDKSLSEILEHLEKIGEAENTFVIFMSDNGGDAPVAPLSGANFGIISSAPLRGKKGTSYEGGMRVPFIAAWAGVNPDNRFQQEFPVDKNVISSNSFVTIEDIMPTVLALSGTPIPQNYKMDGINIMPALAKQNTPTGRKHFLMHFPHNHRSVNYTVYREDGWKLTCHYNRDKSEAYELFNLEEDMSESNNLAKFRSEKLIYMIKQMQLKLNDAGAKYFVSKTEKEH